MNKIQVRIPKAFIGAWFLSFAALIVGSAIITVVVKSIPSTPVARMLAFLAINHNNPVVYTTAYGKDLGMHARLQDAFVQTPIVMFFAGLFFAVGARNVETRRIVGGSIGAGALVAFLTWLMIAILPPIAEAKMAGRAPHYGEMNGSIALQDVAAALVWVAAYTLGSAVLALVYKRFKLSALRDRSPRTQPKTKPA